MKLTILLLSVSLAALSSCTTSYKSGQTPDDVYYSPVRTQNENDYVKQDKEEYNDDYYEDRYLRMKVRNRNRWSDLDDWYYTEYRNRHNVYLGCCYCENNWSPHNYWNTYYNPYYHNYVIVTPVKNPTYNKPRNFNLNAYNPQQTSGTYTNTKYNAATGSNTNNNNYTPRTNSNNSNGNRLRNIFRSETNTTTSSGSSGSSSSNTSGSSGSSGGSKSGSSGSSAPVRRF